MKTVTYEVDLVETKRYKATITVPVGTRGDEAAMKHWLDHTHNYRMVDGKVDISYEYVRDGEGNNIQTPTEEIDKYLDFVTQYPELDEKVTKFLDYEHEGVKEFTLALSPTETTYTSRFTEWAKDRGYNSRHVPDKLYHNLIQFTKDNEA